LITWLRDPEEAGVLTSPEYDTVMVCVPVVVSEDVVYVADPPLKAMVPSVVDPEVKVTLPVGVGPGLDTLAVNVKLCPAKLGLAEDVTAIAEAA
jgi:hypothetical protein